MYIYIFVFSWERSIRGCFCWYHGLYTLGIQSPCQMMSKGCIITSSARYLSSITILRRWLDPYILFFAECCSPCKRSINPSKLNQPVESRYPLTRPAGVHSCKLYASIAGELRFTVLVLQYQGLTGTGFAKRFGKRTRSVDRVWCVASIFFVVVEYERVTQGKYDERKEFRKNDHIETLYVQYIFEQV